MASPLSWFRRNQKGMLIVFGVLLMAVFGLGSVFTSMIPQAGRTSELDEKVVKFNGGDFSRGELQDFRYRHARAVRFVQELQRAQIDRVGQQNYRQRAPLLSMIGSDASPQQADREVMQRVLLLQKAREIGMAVGDDAVIDYLRAIGDEELTEQDMAQFAYDLYKGQPDFITIKEQLKEELTVQQMYNVISSGVPRSPNITDAWAKYLKLNKRRAATLLPFPVEEYLDDVSGEPPLSELREIFARGEYVYPDISGVEPGFKESRKIRTVVFTADLEDFLAIEAAQVKPEEIETRYQEMVEQKNPIVTEFVPVAGQENTGEMPNDGDTPPEFNLDGDDGTGGNPAKSDESAGKAESAGQAEKPGESEGQEENTKPGSGNSGENNSNKKNADKKNADKKNDETESGGDDDGLPRRGPSARSAVALVQDDPQQGEKEKKQGDPGQGDSKQKNKQQDDKQQDDKQQDDKQQDDKQQDDKQQDDKQQEQDDKKGETAEKPGSADPAVENATNPQTSGDPAPGMPAELQPPVAQNPLQDPLIGDLIPQTPQTEMRIKPLDEALSEEIRREIARVPAYNAMLNALNEASGEIADYGSDYAAYEQTKDGSREDREPEPEPLNPRAIADRYKLKFQETELLDLLELRETEVGKIEASVPRNFYGQVIQDRLPLADFLFGQYYQVAPWQPETVVQFRSDNQHVVYITEKVDPQVRTFDEAREDVIRFWKRQQAVELARQAARKVAEEINGSESTLLEKYPAEAREVNEFTFHSQAQLFPVLDGGTRTGPEFMETAFGLESGECGVAADAERENVFVIQITAVDSRTEEELREAFFTELAANRGMSGGINQLYSVDTREFFRQWFGDLEEEQGVKWLAH